MLLYAADYSPQKENQNQYVREDNGKWNCTINKELMHLCFAQCFQKTFILRHCKKKIKKNRKHMA